MPGEAANPSSGDVGGFTSPDASVTLGGMQGIRLSARWLLLPITVACSSQSSSRPTPAPAPSQVSGKAAHLGIPPGHLPPPGSCRVWYPGRPPGRQPAPSSCEAAARAAPAGSWIVYRPGTDRRVVHVREIDRRRAGVVVRVRIFDAASGVFLRDGTP